MITTIVNKGVSIVMALVVLVSTLSFTIESHYCGEHLVDISIFTKAKQCGVDVATTDVTVKTKGCCKNEIEVITGQDQLKINTFDDLQFSTQYFIKSFVYTYSQLFKRVPKQSIPHKNYAPPNLIIDFQVLHDVYII
ncbi:HYC_CC_PP family protein [Olleya sp. HaHaR_3_96]|uniref:HYC_CC_PP family protein n=1 Tax=Olleya sp. HaHaR_3_96 TaxID=2745560 RepID=UPI00211A0D48|nr:hypothetical protein [Olleya sp. HaHaR_3_96]